jgi:Tfp pilus assembly protein PilF
MKLPPKLLLLGLVLAGSIGAIPGAAQISELGPPIPAQAPQFSRIPANQVAAAVAAARKAIEQNPKSAQAYLSLGIALWSGGNSKAALQSLHEALRFDPHLSGAWLELGLIADEQGRVVDATRDFQKALDANPRNTSARFELATEYFRAGKFTDSRTQLEAVLKENPADARALNGIGLLQLQNGKPRAAAESFRRAVHQKHDFVAAQVNLAGTLLRIGDVAGAHAAYQEALQEDPENPKAVYGMARALRALGDKTQADTMFARARKLMQGQTARLRAQDDDNRGLKLWHDADLKGAKVAFRTAISEDASYADAHNNLGGVLWQQGKNKESLQEFRAAVHSNPDFAKAHNNLGNALTANGDIAGAIREFRAAVSLEPAFATAHLNLGMVLMRARQWKQAEGEFRQILLLDPSSANAHIDLGIALASGTNLWPKEAHDEIERGLQLNSALIAAVPEPILHALAMMDRVIAPKSEEDRN